MPAARPMPPDHPDRAAAHAEVHARPIVPITAPTRIRRVAFLFGQDQTAAMAARSRLRTFCGDRAIEWPQAGARRVDFAVPDHHVTWEFHTEFITATWTSRFDNLDPWPKGLGLEVMEGEPVALAVRVDFIDTPTITAGALDGFDERSLCYATVEQGRVEVATDFLSDALGYCRYEVAAGALGPHLSGALIRRLHEIETYRVLALVGINLARAEAPRLSALEAELTTAMGAVGASPDPGASAALLDAMYKLQHAASQSVERTRYRFAASQAYGDILMQRLSELQESPCGEHWTLQGYLRLRIEPALATFRALERRQAALLEQAARSTALLGTRISLDIDQQNRSILGTISDTAKSQFRLQRTVEGLSTIAITYYLLGIVAYALHGIAPAYEHEKAIGIAVFAPLALAAVWYYLRRVHRH